MKKKGLLTLLGSICLVLGLVALPFVTACAPKPARAPTTLRLYGLHVGSYVHSMCQAMGDIVNKNSEWLRIDVLEGMSSSANLAVLQAEPERRTDSIIFCNSFTNDDGREARAPFKAPYVGSRMIAVWTNSYIGLCTADPTIKTIADLKGKTAHFAPRGATPGKVFTKMLELEGILDQVKVSYGSWGAMGTAWTDGLVDVAIASDPGFAGIGIFVQPREVEMFTARKPTNIYFSPDQLEKTRVALGYRVLPYATMPADSILPGQAEYPVFRHDQGWWADETLDEEVAYELTKTLVENLDKFGAYTKLGEYMRPDNIACAPVPSDLVHPGALRYFQKNKIPVGFDAW